MRQNFIEYIELTEKEKNELWNEAIFVFDTNVLLNLYRYSSETQNALLKSIESLKDRIWLPHQVAYEFLKDRYEIIFETVDRYDFLIQQSNKLICDIRATLRLKKDDKMLQKLENEIHTWINNKKTIDLKVSSPSKDPILNELIDFYDGRIGKIYEEQELNSIYKSGESRYEQQIPPGYKDEKKNKKEKNSGFGDLIMWNQIIDYAKEVKKPFVFVTHDQKEDWWLIVKGKTIGPRPELVREFNKETSCRILMYSMNSFLEQIQSSEVQFITESVLNEVIRMDENNQLYLNGHYNKDINNLIKNIERVKYQIQKREKALEGNRKSLKKNPNTNLALNIENTQRKIQQYEHELASYYEKLDALNYKMHTKN